MPRPTGLSRLDLLDEAISGALGRPLRTALTAAGAVIGIGALVATIGIAQTAGAQILARFDELEATEVVASLVDRRAEVAPAEVPGPFLPLSADGRIERLSGVVASGSLSELDVGVVTGALADPAAVPQQTVLAASPGLLRAVRGRVREGRWIDPYADRTGQAVAVLGPAAALRLGVARVDNQPTVMVGGMPFVVIGILDRVARHSELLDAVVVPEGTAAERFALAGPGRVIADTELGAAELIARQMPLALSPSDPEAVAVQAPADLSTLRGGAASEVSALSLLLSGVLLVVGALGIANVTLVAVYERIGELGLRRALGATRSEVMGQILLESTLTGLLGGCVGMTAGLAVLLGTSAHRGWTPVLDWRLLLAAPTLGAVVGLLAGCYPSWRAGAIEPASAVRRTIG